MKSILKISLLAVIAFVGMVSCSDDNFTDSIYDTTDYPLDQTAYTFPLDSFVKREFLQPFNVKFIYRMEDVGSDMDKNLTPAPYDKSVQLAALSKWLWFDCYATLAGEKEVFLKKYSPRILHVIGSKNYNPTQGTETLGVAEGGIKISLYNVDNLDCSDIEMMNEYFFKTMHHEFGHILDQTHLRPTKFNLVSNGLYDSMGWTEAADSLVLGKGFVTPYASSAVGEDWVEVLANYVTRDELDWNAMMHTATYDWEEIDCEDWSTYMKMIAGSNNLDTIGYFKANENGEGKIYRRVYERNDDDSIIYDAEGNPIPKNVDGNNGYDVIMEKLQMVREWLAENYKIDVDELRAMVQERMYVKNPDGTWKLDSRGRLVNRLTNPEDGYPRLIDKLTDEIYKLKVQ